LYADKRLKQIVGGDVGLHALMGNYVTSHAAQTADGESLVPVL